MTMPWFDSFLLEIGGAMLASFWWIACIGCVAAVAVRFPARPVMRHALLTGALALTPLPFVASLHWGAGAAPGTMSMATLASIPDVIRAVGVPDGGWERPAATAWLCGVLLLSLRTFGGWLYLRRLIRRATPIDLPVLDGLRARLGLQTVVQVRTTKRADSPFAAGSVVVLPVAMLTGLPAQQLEAVLLHELAHIRRGDYMAEWLLQVLETLFFYHPAVWWLSAALRREREQCCDDAAIGAGADHGAFVDALLRMEEMRVPALANGGAGTDLHGRVARLLGQPTARVPWAAMLALLLTGAGLLAPLTTAQQAGDPYRNWVDQDVVYIIQPEERKAFLSLKADEERKMFIEQFWTRREPKMKEEHYRRIVYANGRFKEKDKSGWSTERGRTYIVYGPPDEMEVHPDKGYEQWYYKKIPGVGNNVIFEFGSRRGAK